MALASVVLNFVHPAWGLVVGLEHDGMMELAETDEMLKNGSR